MVIREQLQAVLNKYPSARLIHRAANFLADQARRNLHEAEHIKAARLSALYVRRVTQGQNLRDTSLALQQVATNKYPTCEYCGAATWADRMLCDNCNEGFADRSF